MSTTPPCGCTRITTLFIEDFQAKNITEKDTFVKFNIDGKKYKTKVHKKTLHPSWSDKFTVTTTNKIEELTFSIISQNILGNNVKIGTAKYSLSLNQQQQQQQITNPLRSSTGSLSQPQSNVQQQTNSNNNNVADINISSSPSVQTPNHHHHENGNSNTTTPNNNDSTITTNSSVSDSLETFSFDYWTPIEREKGSSGSASSTPSPSYSSSNPNGVSPSSNLSEFKVKILVKCRDIYLDTDTNSATSLHDEPAVQAVPPSKDFKAESANPKEMSIIGKGGSQILKLTKKITSKSSRTIGGGGVNGVNGSPATPSPHHGGSPHYPEKTKKEQQAQQRIIEEQLAKERQKEIERENAEREKERAREKLRQREQEEQQKQVEKERQEERRRAKEDKKKKEKELKYVPDRPIDYFFVVGLSTKLEPIDQRYDFSPKGTSPIDKIYKGELLEYYPHKENNDILPKHIWMYCYPKGISLQSDPQQPSFFPFVLTSETGSRFYASCLTFYEPISDDLYSELKKNTIAYEHSLSTPTVTLNPENESSTTTTTTTTTTTAATTDDKNKESTVSKDVSKDSTPSTSSSTTTTTTTPVITTTNVLNNDKDSKDTTPAKDTSKDTTSTNLDTSISTSSTSSTLKRIQSGNTIESNFPSVLYAPKCICLLSHFPFFSAFRISLNEIYHKVFFSSTPLPIERYIYNLVQEIPLPQPGANIVSFNLGGQTQIPLKRPSDCLLPTPDLSFNILFKCLDIRNVLLVLKCILLEEKIIIISSQYSLLTYISEIISSLLYPLQFPHVYVPILPELLLEYVYSPFPFIMGVHKSYSSTILNEENLLSEIVVVDLDNNTVHIPPTDTKDIQLPERETAQLINQLRRVVQFEILSADLPNFNLNTLLPISSSYNTDKRLQNNNNQKQQQPLPLPLAPTHPDDFIRFSFLQFFCNMLGDYRKFYKYLRVFPQPIAIFNKEEYVKSKPQSARPFLTRFMDTQSFSFFLEQHNWPTKNLFDYLVETKKYTRPIDDLVAQYQQSIPQALGVTDANKLPVINVPSPASYRSYSTSIREYTKFPSLKQDLFNPNANNSTGSNSSVNPIIKSNSASSTPSQTSPSVTPLHDMYIHSNADHTPSLAEQAAGNDILATFSEDQHRSFVPLIRQFLTKVFNDTLPEQSDIQQMTELVKFDYGRSIFGKLLLHHYYRQNYVSSCTSMHNLLGGQQDNNHIDTTKARLSDPLFYCLGDILKNALREANFQSDFTTSQMFLEASFIYHRLQKGSNEFVSERIRNLDIWQNYRFWEKIFYDSIESKCKSLYGNNVVREMVKWGQYPSEKQEKMMVEERDMSFSLLSNLVFNMINLGSQTDLVRRFVNKMCTCINFDAERTDTMMQIVSNISRARDMVDMDQDAIVEGAVENNDKHILKDKNNKEDLYLPIGSGGSGSGRDQLNHEGRELLNSLIDEKSSVVAIKSFSRIMNLKTTWHENRSKKHDKVAFREISENRGDYVVKTFTGHQEGVLCVSVAQKESGLLITGSADSTLKVWDMTSTRCIGTLEDHSGWVTACETTSDSKLISGSYDKTLKLWDLNKCIKVKSLRGHKGAISCISNADTNIVISGSYDNTINVWDTRNAKPSITLFGHQQPIMCLVASDAYKVISGSRDTNIRIWDIRTSTSISILSGHSDWIKCLEWDNADLLLSGSSDGRVKVWSLQTGECVKTLQSHSGSINSILLHSKVENDGSSAPKKFITASSDSTMKVWDSNYGESYNSLEGHTDEVMNVSKFINNLVVSGSFDGTVKLWDVDAGKCQRTLHNHSHRISSLRTFDSSIVTTSWDKTAKVCQFNLDFRC
ncbi:hypothetical protein CYY_004307 [Polysphondylium violaceum]|uniref:WD40 repeat-containing protein n=1 Tax=Polysphondylium violaceum TaxID=133409 RepID=A0A8J4PTI3_9MYCE|nr:hypothetical protein CYY_004307 [Polysphondylium violaceum]